MSEKKELNNKELEKVSGGIKTVGNIQLFSDCDNDFKVGAKVCIYSGAYHGNSFKYMCDGIITSVINGYSSNTWRVNVKASSPSIKNVSFFSTFTCTINNATVACWFGPKTVSN